MKALITKLFAKRLKTLNIILLVNGVFVLINAASFPLLEDQQESFLSIMKNMPEGFIKAFGLDKMGAMTFEGFMATKHFMPFWIIILLVAAIPAATFISKSLDNNTAELLFAQPISRIKSGLSVFISALLQTLYFAVISIVTIIPLCLIFSTSPQYLNYLLLTIESIGFTYFLVALIFTADVFINDSGKVMGLMILFTAGSYMLSLMSKIVTDLEFLKYFSVFNYFDPSTSLDNGEFNIAGLLGFILIGSVLLLIAIIRHNKRDLIK